MVKSFSLLKIVFWIVMILPDILFGQEKIDLTMDSTTNWSNYFTNRLSLTGSLSNTAIPIQGWKNFQFGLDYDQVKASLAQDHPDLRWKEDPPNLSGVVQKDYLQTYKGFYYEKIEFQFNQEEKLYLIRLTLNQRYFSFLKLYKNLYTKYGPPQENNFQRIVWTHEDRSIQLDRHSVVLYQAKKLISASPIPQSENQSIFDQNEKIDQIMNDL